jgi:hypothetical protein
MTKIQVISVDLGDPVEWIISNDVQRLSEETLTNIKAAADQKVPGPTKMDIETLAVQSAYNLLISALQTKEEVGIDKLLEASYPTITNPSALMMRMKHFLRKRGNDFALRKSSRDGKAVYRLIPFNIE